MSVYLVAMNAVTESLIEAVRGSEVLYNMNMEGYRNIRLTNKKWDEIGAILGMTGNIHNIVHHIIIY